MDYLLVLALVLALVGMTAKARARVLEEVKDAKTALGSVLLMATDWATPMGRHNLIWSDIGGSGILESRYLGHYWYLNRQVPGRTLLGHRKAGMAHCKLAGWEKVQEEWAAWVGWRHRRGGQSGLG